MRKYVAIATVLLLAHTLEEAFLRFWESDLFSISIADYFHASPATIYWIGQALLYLFLTTLLYAKETRIKKWGHGFLCLLLLFEMEHVIVAIQHGTYEAGLISAIALTLYGIFFTTKIYPVV